VPDEEVLRLAEPYDRETQSWLSRVIGESASELIAEDARFRDTAIFDSARPVGASYREYASESVAAIRFIKQLQEVGFTLREIREFIGLLERPHHDPEETRAVAVAKIRTMDEQIGRLQAMRAELNTLLKSCACCKARPSNAGGKVSVRVKRTHS
jgi:DNA-binding transcriptional MerR regulator